MGAARFAGAVKAAVLRSTRISYVLIGVSLTLAACGDSDTSTDGTAAPTTTQAATTPTATPAKAPEGEAQGEAEGKAGAERSGLPPPDEADKIGRGLTLEQVFERLGDSREQEPRDRIDCMYWRTTDPTQEIEVCFTNETVSRSKSSRLVPASCRARS